MSVSACIKEMPYGLESVGDTGALGKERDEGDGEAGRGTAVASLGELGKLG